MDHISLSKLNVAKLKEKCKEFKITGYSKLSKPLLIERLLYVPLEQNSLIEVRYAYSAVCRAIGSSFEGNGEGFNVTSSGTQPVLSTKVADVIVNDTLGVRRGKSTHLQTVEEPEPQGLDEGSPGKAVIITKKRPKNDKDDKGLEKKKERRANIVTSNDQQASGTDDPQVTAPLKDPHNYCSDPQNGTTAIKKDFNNICLDQPCPIQINNDSTDCMLPISPRSIYIHTKEPESVHRTPATEPHESNVQPTSAPFVTSIHSPASNSNIHTSSNQVVQPQPQPQVSGTLPRKPQTYNPKSFKPPILRAPCINPPKLAPRPATTANETGPAMASKENRDLYAPDLPLISMPPSTARRRQAERMSVVFSGIKDCEVLGLCIRVSKAWRYAVYLSATHALHRDFSGTRLDSIVKWVKEPRMTNMWAYLRARRLEVQSRYDAFRGSWLGRFFEHEREVLGFERGFEPVDQRMWTSPGDGRQIDVVLRFVSTRVVFSLARRYSEYDQKWINSVDQVIGAEEIVPDEIWRITTRSSAGGKLKGFHILYDTGEVIGLAQPSAQRGISGQRVAKNRPHIEVLESEPGDLRADWRAYISSCELSPGSSLQDLIVSGDRESYVAGVSTFWLRSLSLEDEVLRSVAHKYVLSSVEPNSVSGEYRAVIDMAGDIAGIPSYITNGKPRHQVGLYISEHHLVESVHIPISLHPTLAMVVTASGREYFVLRDTGVPVGASDQGLELLWQRLIGCDAWGSRCAYTARAIG
ncbi:hypothetical protein RHS03_00538, partial [Rhizoctonia solani]